MQRILLCLFCLLVAMPVAVVVSGCASEPAAPPAPDWIRGASRTVDNGYIVYIGKGEAARADDAQFKAEGLALEDLANECSMIPKGTRVEDRYLETTKTGYTSYTKVALQLQECDEATKANDPEEIRKIANAGFTTQLKKYQDLEETGFRSADEGDEIEPPTEVAAAPVQGSANDHVHFYVTRQYIAYQKEIVVLSPRTYYQPGAPETVAFSKNVVPATQTVAGMETKDPALRTAPVPWSKVPDRPHIDRPASLQKAALRSRAQHLAPPHPSAAHGKPGSHPGQPSTPPPKKKRRRHY